MALTALVATGQHVNREHWLTDLAGRSERFFVNIKLPAYKLTCGWPLGGALSRKRQVLGQCFDSKVSVGEVHELFITPLLDDPLQVAGVVLHEMTHVAAGVDAGHKGRFIRIAQHIGLTKGKPISALPGERLNEYLTKLVDQLGPYPHKAVKPVPKEKQKNTKDVPLICPDCECRVRMTLKWMTASGVPTCGCGGLFEEYVRGERQEDPT
jgi:hypothetical protein